MTQVVLKEAAVTAITAYDSMCVALINGKKIPQNERNMMESTRDSLIRMQAHFLARETGMDFEIFYKDLQTSIPSPKW